MNNAFVSVIVPVYKVEKYIAECIECVLHQTYRNYELILVDDGSPDRSGAICDEYAEKYGFITVLHQKNQGQAAARNHAIAVARGEYVSFLDSDDLLHPQALELFTECIKKTGACAAFGGNISGEDVPDSFFQPVVGKITSYEIDEEKLTDLYGNSRRYWCVWSGMMRREIVQKYPFPEGHFYEDNAIMPRWLYEHGKIAEIDAPLYFYRTNQGSTTQSGMSMRYGDYVWALEKQLEFLEEIHYGSLYNILAKNYLITASRFYEYVKRVAKKRKNAAELRRHFCAIYKKCKGKIELNDSQSIYIRSVVHTHTVRYYRYYLNLRWRIKNRRR